MKIISEYLLCAAIHFDNGIEYSEQPRGIKTGFVVTGRRHNNCFKTAFILHGEENVQNLVRNGEWKISEGFVSNKDNYYDRRASAVIAYNSKQVDELHEMLISEHLYLEDFEMLKNL